LRSITYSPSLRSGEPSDIVIFLDVDRRVDLNEFDRDKSDHGCHDLLISNWIIAVMVRTHFACQDKVRLSLHVTARIHLD
jgi:hypothetical protein